jgi:carbon storage regulator CsrA
MLVLSRRPDESIVFPSLGVMLRVLRVQGNVVRVGIEAPPDVQILREELPASAMAEASVNRRRPTSFSHALRNQLNKISLRLHLLDRQIEVGQLAAADQTLTQVLDGMEREWEAGEVGRDHPADGRSGRYRVLIVEDDANERELLAGLLTMNGCECATAEDGLAALSYLSTAPRPDFVLLDMRMPRCDGPQTLRQLRSSPVYDGLRVFAISGTSPEELGLATGTQCVDAWFSKPLNPRTLCDAMRLHRNTAQAN